MVGATVGACLAAVGISETSGLAALAQAADLSAEFSVIKKSFLKRVLIVHPDKGGDEETFRECRTSFDTLRELYETGAVDSFANEEHPTGNVYEHRAEEAKREGPAPPWDFYAEAAEEAMPTYRMELAKSDRSKCQKCKTLIAKGSVRLGWLDQISGTYGRWTHVQCWRVPSKVWLGLPTDKDAAVGQNIESLVQMGSVIIDGMASLSAEARVEVASHCMDRSNWAKKAARKEKPKEDDEIKRESSGNGGEEVKMKEEMKTENALVAVEEVKKEDGAVEVVKAESALVAVAPSRVSSAIVKQNAPGRFQTPEPGPGVSDTLLRGQKVVITGTFPEIGGGSGLELGKARVANMVQAFGGRVTQAVSGATTMLVVGKNPGFSKFSKAKSRGIKCVSLHDLAETLRAGAHISKTPAFATEMRVRDFSSGYKGNGLAGMLLGAPETVVELEEEPAPMKRSKTAPIPRSRAKKSAPKKKRGRRVKEEEEEEEEDSYGEAEFEKEDLAVVSRAKTETAGLRRSSRARKVIKYDAFEDDSDEDE